MRRLTTLRPALRLGRAWGGHEKGWAEQVAKRYDWAASRFKGAEGPIEFENISLVVTPGLA
jgi:hypothetical protein